MTGTGYSRYQQQEDIEYMTAAAGETDIIITVIITIIITLIPGLDSMSHYSPVEVTGVRLPLYGMYGGVAELRCHYTSVMPVYSVKWYKNGKEFYRLAARLIPAAAKWAEFMKISASLPGFITFNPLQLSPGQG